MTDSPVVGSSSSVVSPAPSYSPPISTVPNGEAQLVWEAPHVGGCGRDPAATTECDPD